MSMSAADQYLLEMMNRARLDPEAEAERYGIDLNAGLSPGAISTGSKQVLAPNQLLDAAATQHSQWMLDTDTFSHTGSGGTQPWDRAGDAGYDWSTIGENIAWVGSTGTLNLESAVESLHKNLFLSAGHRQNLMNDAFREVGVAVETGVFRTNTNYNAAMVTELFGKSGNTVFLTGVAYDDTDGDDFYSMGEGQGGVSFAAQNVAGVTESAGGYSLGLTASAAVAVTGSVDGLAFSCTVDMSQGNVKLDIVSGDTFFSSGSIQLGTGIENLVLLGLNGLSATGTANANDILGNKGANAISGLAGDDTLTGGEGNDRLDGGDGRDRLLGQAGKDNLIGGKDGDVLSGGGGNDTLNGGAGKDKLTGGSLADTFIFATGFGADQIKDFDIASDDVLRLDDAIWGNLALTSDELVGEYATVQSNGVLLDFGGGNSILLLGLTTTAGLADQIDII